MITNQERFDYLLKVYQEINEDIDNLVITTTPQAYKVIREFDAVAQELIALSKCSDVEVLRS